MNFTCIRWGIGRVQSLNEGRKFLAGKFYRESYHIFGQILAGYLVGLTGKEEKNFELLSALNPANFWHDFDVASFRWSV